VLALSVQVPGLSKTDVREAVRSLPEHLQEQLEAAHNNTMSSSTQPGVVDLLGWDEAQSAFVPVVKAQAHALPVQQAACGGEASTVGTDTEVDLMPMEVGGSVVQPVLLDSLPAKLAAITAGEL
jgi:hypothetical protein